MLVVGSVDLFFRSEDPEDPLHCAYLYIYIYTTT